MNYATENGEKKNLNQYPAFALFEIGEATTSGFHDNLKYPLNV